MLKVTEPPIKAQWKQDTIPPCTASIRMFQLGKPRIQLRPGDRVLFSIAGTRREMGPSAGSPSDSALYTDAGCFLYSSRADFASSLSGSRSRMRSQTSAALPYRPCRE